MRIQLSTAALLLVSRAALAQQPDTTVLRPIVVSATRTPIDKQAAPASVTVIRGQDLQSRGIANVADALATVPGLSLVRSGSFGATTSLFARGGESDYVKVLVDGVPLNNPGGSFDFANLTTDNLDRIEVVRGPVSVVYGSDAVAGVVQLFTRRGAGAPRGYADIRAGTFSTIEGSVGVSGGSSVVGYSLGAANRQTDGALAFNNDYWNRTASGRLSLAPSFASVDLTTRRTDASFHFPTDGAGNIVDSNSVRRDHRTIVGLDASKHLTSRVDLRIVGAASRLDGGSSNQPDSPGDTTGFYSKDDSRIERRSVDLRTDIRAAANATLSLGAAVEREQARNSGSSQFQTFPSSSSTFAAHRTNEAFYAQVVGGLDRVTYTASGRVDDNGDYGNFVTGRASLALQITPNASVRAAIGNAFKAPAFEETFSSSFTIGNTNLDPERTLSWEASAEYRVASRLVMSATYFDQRFRDLIQYVLGDATTDFRGTNENLGAATARGLELDAQAPRLGRFDLGANLTLLRTRVTDAGNGAFGTFVNGDRLLRRPAQSGAVSADFRVAKRSKIGAVVRYVGKRDDRDFNADERIELPAYTLLDLSTELSLAPAGRVLAPLTITGRVENVFDKKYQPAFGFRAPGTTVLVGMRAALGGH